MGLEVKKPEGAFYIFPSIKKFHTSSTDFCKRFAEEYKVAIIPGDCFEADDFIRLSYCVDFETIKTACDRLEQFIKTLGGK
ncbi:MAG: aminotransferase class I/II-fold pyridoxal phosphate-dependent enzyme, partial [Anaeroplasmataceae bacterium]|nr:aminotransferase class I/II-fold pyridoxal phosphate-dependent enzyme [Anaeroplasmataceae bacterium]